MFGITATGAMMRMFRDSQRRIYRSDAGAPIPWAYQPGVLKLDRAGVKFVKVEAVPVASGAQPLRTIMLMRDGGNEPFLLVSDQAWADIRRFDQIPVSTRPGNTLEVGIAARDASVMVRRFGAELDSMSGSRGT